jgi:hypothetical protein
VKPIYRSLAAALVGASIVLVAMWLSESVVPSVLFVPLEASSLAILLVLLVGGAVVVHRGRVLEAAALLAGAGAFWALRDVQPLSLCQSNVMLYRPCTARLMAWMALPGVALLIAGSILLVSFLARTRASR